MVIKTVTDLADEAIRVPLCVKRGDVILHNGLAAAAAFGCKHIEIIRAAVWLAIALMEPFFSELLAALRAEEVLSVPRLLQSGHAFL